MKSIRCCDIMWDTEKHETCPDCDKRLVPPKGSDSGDLLPDTRSVGGNQSTKSNGSEKPLPDQGWGAKWNADIFGWGLMPETPTKMQPHQQRVVDEKSELDDKREKLSAFKASNPLYFQLPEAEQHRLSRQLAIMTEYSEVLGERIAAFPAE